MQANLIFKELRIKNARVFKDITIPLDKQGVVSIQGKNGVGKSLIWSILEVIFFNMTPSGHKRDELTNNDEDAEYSILYTKDEDEYEVSYSRKKGKWKHTIFINGKDKTPHSSIDSVTLAKNVLLNLTQKEFEGSIHLVQNAQHILIEGTPSVRNNYIKNFFGIDDRYDILFNKAQGESDIIIKKIEVLSGYSHTLSHLKNELEMYPTVDTTYVNNSINSLILEEKSFTEIEIKLDKELEKLILYEKLFPITQKYKDPEKEKITYTNDILTIKKSILDIKGIKEQNFFIAENNKLIEEVNKIIAPIKEKYADIDSIDNVTGLELYNNIVTLQLKYQQYNSALPSINEYNKINSKYVDTLKLTKQVNDLYVEIKQFKDKLALIKNGKCPTCGTTFDASPEAIEKTIAELEPVYNELLQEIKDFTAENTKYNRKQSLKPLVEKYLDFDISQFEPLPELLSKYNQWDIYAREKNKINNLGYKSLLDVPDATALLKEEKELQQKLLEVDECISAIKSLPAKPKKKKDIIEKSILEVKKDIQRVKGEITVAQQTLGVLNQKNQTAIRIQNQIKQLEMQLSEMPELKAKERFWKIMVEAYGPKGLRVGQMKKIMDVVMTRLPFYTNKLFSEKNMEFTHKVEAGTVEIYVKRQWDDGKVFSHDISSFSGGESKRMSIAFVLSLADCVPFKKKANMIVLDELDANLEAEGQHMFINELLPVLKERYSSVFITSHAEEIKQSMIFDQVWNFKKGNHNTTIHKKQLSKTY